MAKKDGKTTAAGRTTSGKEPTPVLTMTAKHDGEVTALAFSPRGNVLASGSHDATVRLWNLRTGEEIARHTKKKFSWGIIAVAFSPYGHTVASLSEGVKGSDKGQTQPFVWDLITREATEVAAKDRFRYQFRSPVFSPASDVLALGGGAIRLFDGRIGEQLGEPFPKSACNVLSFAPDGIHLVSGHREGDIRIWDVAGRNQLGKLAGHTSWVTFLAFSPDGQFLASAADDGTIRLWDFTKRREQRQWSGDWEATSYLAFVDDGELVSFDPADRGTVRRWSVVVDEEVGGWTPKKGMVRSVAVSADGKRIATGDEFGTILIWELDAALQRR